RVSHAAHQTGGTPPPPLPLWVGRSRCPSRCQRADVRSSTTSTSTSHVSTSVGAGGHSGAGSTHHHCPLFVAAAPRLTNTRGIVGAAGRILPRPFLCTWLKIGTAGAMRRRAVQR